MPSRRRLTAIVLVVLAGVCIAALALLWGRPAPTGRLREGEIAFQEALAILGDRALREGGDLKVVEAIKVIRRARDPRAAGVLVEAIDFVPRAGPNSGPGGSGPQPPLWELHPVLPAVIELGEDAIPHIVDALAEEVTREYDYLTYSEGYAPREWFLFCAFAAIMGPHGGVRELEQAIRNAKEPLKQDRLRLALRKFREFHHILLLFPEEEEAKQPYHGPIKKVLEEASDGG